jgi:hypothetical protein
LELVVKIFTKMTLFPAKNLVFRKKNRPQYQGQFSKLKDLSKKSKLHALERFFLQEGGGGGNL